MSNRAAEIHSRIYDMYPQHASKEKCSGKAFPMYSFERPASIFWRAYIDKLIELGLNDDQVEWLLRSKHMRWMLDQQEEEIEKLAQSMVTENDIKAAKES